MFGQGRTHTWTYLTTDSEGSRYYLDEPSLRRLSPHVAVFYLKKEGKQRASFHQWLHSLNEGRFTLDFKANTLQKDGEAPVLIPPGTIADDLRRQVATRLQ